MPVNFDDFNKKNKNKTEAFENMCRIMFLRNFNKSPHDYQYDFNNAGLEIHPIQNDKDGKWYGLQCKYFLDSTDNSKRYKQIYDSVEKAIKYYKEKLNKLDEIFIYTNSNFITVDYSEVRKMIEEGKDLGNNHKIVKIAYENNVELRWEKTDNIIDSLTIKGNHDLYRMYFNDSRETDFLENTVTYDEKTFLQSKEYIDLTVNGGKQFDCIHKYQNQNISALIGSAGTGKSLILKKIFIKYADDFLNYYFRKKKQQQEQHQEQHQEEQQEIPIFIKLGMCPNGDLENVIRNKLQDYNIVFKSTETKYLYLLDGIDEVADYNISTLVHQINKLSQDKNTNIIITSRTDSSNYLSILQEIKEINTYKIDAIDEEQIKKFFNSKLDEFKTDKLKNILSENEVFLDDINDILSLTLLFENIEAITPNDTKISLVKLSINNIVDKYSKFHYLNILEPKQEKIIEVCKKIAIAMQEIGDLTIDISKVQTIIKEYINVDDNNQINIIVNALCDMFLQKSGNKLMFNHRRYQEYFLFLSVYQEYFKNPSILRKLNLITNKDFIINIFLKEISCDLNKKFDLVKCVGIGLLESYLGIKYFKGSNYNLSNKKLLYSFDELYNGEESLLYLLSLYDNEYLKTLFDNKSVNVSNFVGDYSHNNIYKFLEIFHRENSKKISQEIIELLGVNLNEGPNIDYSKRYSNLYCKYKFEVFDINTLYNKLEDFRSIDIDALYKTGNAEYTNDRMYAFFRIVLEFELEWLTEKIESMSNEELDLISFCLLEPLYIELLAGDGKKSSNFKDAFIKKYGCYNQEYGLCTLIVFSLIKGSVENKEVEQKLLKFWEEKNQYHIWTWNDTRHINHAIGFLLNKQEKGIYDFASLGFMLFKTFYINYNNTKELMVEWRDNLISANFRYRTNLRYSNSKELGIYISHLNVYSDQLKEFFIDLTNYDNQIYLPTVIWEVYKNNRNTFDFLFSRSYLCTIYNDYRDRQDSYEEKIDFNFKFATMFFKFDKKLSEELFLKGLNDSFLRPEYRHEDFVDIILVCSLYYGHINFWIDNSELNQYSSRLLNMLKVMESSRVQGGNTESLKWFTEEYLNKDKVNINTNGEPKKPHILDSVGTRNIEIITDELIQNLFIDGNEGFDFKTWQKIISHNKFNIEIVFDQFLKLYLPDFRQINFYSDYCYCIAALMQNDTYKDMVINYINSTRSKYSSIMFFKVFSILGYSSNGKRLIEFLFNFAEMLVRINTEDSSELSSNEFYEILEKIYCTNNDNWRTTDENTYILKSNPDIRIVSREEDDEDKEMCTFEWATKFPDKKAYRIEYDIFYKNNRIDSFALVAVDGYRAYLPFPYDYDKMLVKRNKYHLAKILNYSEDEFRSYLSQAGLKII